MDEMTQQERDAVKVFLSFARMNSDVQKRHFGKFVVRKWLFEALKKRLKEYQDSLGEIDCSISGLTMLVCNVPVECDVQNEVSVSIRNG